MGELLTGRNSFTASRGRNRSGRSFRSCRSLYTIWRARRRRGCSGRGCGFARPSRECRSRGRRHSFGSSRPVGVVGGETSDDIAGQDVSSGELDLAAVNRGVAVHGHIGGAGAVEIAVGGEEVGGTMVGVGVLDVGKQLLHPTVAAGVPESTWFQMMVPPDSGKKPLKSSAYIFMLRPT